MELAVPRCAQHGCRKRPQCYVHGTSEFCDIHMGENGVALAVKSSLEQQG
jgi:hypothetical protein